MQFSSTDPSVVRSIKQRVLLNAWLREHRRTGRLPKVGGFRPEGMIEELPDMMQFEIDAGQSPPRFFITHEGANLSAAYGNKHVAPEQRTGRYLDQALHPEIYQRVFPSYAACLQHARPTYSISLVQDADGKDVHYERLLLPFGSEAVTDLIGSYKAISIEGGFKIDNLLGLRPHAQPVPILHAVIDRDLAPPAGGGPDVVER